MSHVETFVSHAGNLRPLTGVGPSRAVMPMSTAAKKPLTPAERKARERSRRQEELQALRARLESGEARVAALQQENDMLRERMGTPLHPITSLLEPLSEDDPYRTLHLDPKLRFDIETISAMSPGAYEEAQRVATARCAVRLKDMIDTETLEELCAFTSGLDARRLKTLRPIRRDCGGEGGSQYDPYRLQMDDKVRGWPARLEQRLRHDLLRRGFPCCHPSLLVSLPGGPPQGSHADRGPYSFILALDGLSYVNLELRYADEWGSRLERVFLRKGDVLMFPGDQLHGGEGFSVMNVRMHWFSHAPDPRQGQTFVLPDQRVMRR